MKSKLLLLILSFSVVLFGCKKEKTPEEKLADVKRQVIGTWSMQSSTNTFYDASGKVVKTEPVDIDKDIQVQFVDNATLKTSDSPNNPYPYTLTNVDGKIILDVANERFELKVNNNTMSWSTEAEVDDAPIVKGVNTIQLKKI